MVDMYVDLSKSMFVMLLGERDMVYMYLDLSKSIFVMLRWGGYGLYVFRFMFVNVCRAKVRGIWFVCI